MKIIARHKNLVKGVVITESEDENYKGKYAYRRYTATIRGFRNWKIFQGEIKENTIELVINKVKEIRNKIDNNDELIFKIKGYFIK